MPGIQDFITTNTTNNGETLTESKLQEIFNGVWNGGVDLGFEQEYLCKFKKEKHKMSKKATHKDVQEALESFAAELGLDYSTCREELNSSKIASKFLPEVNEDVTIEVTKETKDKPLSQQERLLQYYYGHSRSLYYPNYQTSNREKEATLLGKVNAIAEFLGIEFKVTPEHVVAEKVKAVKKTTVKKTAVKVTKKGKK
jgi:hypothetical protein